MRRAGRRIRGTNQRIETESTVAERAVERHRPGYERLVAPDKVHSAMMEIPIMFALHVERKAPLLPWVKWILVVWLVTFPVTLPVIPGSWLAAGSEDCWHVWLFVWSALTYPMSVGFAWFFRRRCPPLVLVPCVNLVLWGFAGSFSHCVP
jgi:hypothetical protein